MTEETTVEKAYIRYFVSITKNETTTFKSLKTFLTDSSPFVEVDDSWEEASDLPDEDINLIREDDVTETDADTNESVDVVYKYYYTHYSLTESTSVYVSGFCVSCIFYKKGSRMRKHLCSHPEHVIHDWITGGTFEDECKNHNSNGECRYFTLNAAEVEDEESTGTTDTDTDTADTGSDDSTADSESEDVSVSEDTDAE